MNIELGKTKKELTLLLILVMLVIVAAYFNIFIRPIMEKLFELLPKVSMLESDLEAAKELIAGKADIAKENEVLKERMAAYRKMLTSEEEIPRFLESLSFIAGESGIKIKGIRPLRSSSSASIKEDGIYKEIPVEIEAKSGYHELGIFLQNLECGEKYLMISDIEIEGDPKNMKLHDVRLIASTFAISGKR